MTGCVIQSKSSQPDSLGRLGLPGEPMAAKETAELEVFGEQGGSWGWGVLLCFSLPQEQQFLCLLSLLVDFSFQ